MRLTGRLWAVSAAAMLSLCGCALTESSSVSREDTSSPAQTEVTATTATTEQTTAPPPETQGTEPAVTEPEPPPPTEEELQRQRLIDISALLPDYELENKLVRRMAVKDISPSADGSTAPSLSLFEYKYGGEVEWISVPREERFNTLASLRLTGESPDLFPTDSMDTFPYGAARDMFMPVNGFIDFDSDLWRGTEKADSFFDLAGSRYAAVTDILPRYLCVYSRSAVERSALTDPAELFVSGAWQLSVFEDMCADFGGTAALCGTAFPAALSEACGTPLLTPENGSIISNLDSPQLEKVQQLLYELGGKTRIAYRDELGKTLIRDGDGLFYPVLTSELLNDPSAFGDFGIVPLPSLSAEDQYMPASLSGYHIPAGAQNPEGAARFIECERAAAEVTFEQTLKALGSAGWDDGMLDMLITCRSLARSRSVFSCADGMTVPEFSLMVRQMYEGVFPVVNGIASPWRDTVSASRKQVEYAVLLANDTHPMGP